QPVLLRRRRRPADLRDARPAAGVLPFQADPPAPDPDRHRVQPVRRQPRRLGRLRVLSASFERSAPGSGSDPVLTPVFPHGMNRRPMRRIATLLIAAALAGAAGLALHLSDAAAQQLDPT